MRILELIVFFSAEEQYMGLGIVNHVMYPTRGLLHSNGPPLILAEESIVGNVFGELLW